MCSTNPEKKLQTYSYTWRICYILNFWLEEMLAYIDSGSVESVDRESCLHLYLDWLEGVSRRIGLYDAYVFDFSVLEKFLLILRCMRVVAN